MANEYMANNAECLRQTWAYDIETGKFTRRVKSGRWAAGSEVGTIHHTGYVKMLFDGKQYLAHRLAWLYVYGEWPSGQLDHINRDKTDNRIANLRVATSAQNNANRVTSAPISGKRGVYPAGEKFRARIMVDGYARHLGCFDSPSEASAAYEREWTAVYGSIHSQD